MADREGSHTPKQNTGETPGADRRKGGDIVGRDVPDESKERHTEIAVEAGHKGGERPKDKR